MSPAPARSRSGAGDIMEAAQTYANSLTSTSSVRNTARAGLREMVVAMCDALNTAEIALRSAGFTITPNDTWKPPVGPSPTPLLTRIDTLTAEVAEWRNIAESDGSAAYGDCCTLLEAWQRGLPAEQRGPEGTLTGWIEWAAARLSSCDVMLLALHNELEVERMRLAACGVAAMCNTPETAEPNTGKIKPEYRSDSLEDVERMVQSLLMLRAEREKMDALMASAQPAGEVTVMNDGIMRRINHEFEAVLMLPPGVTKLYAGIVFTPVTAWQPIETAPKTGEILLRWPGNRTPCVGSWNLDAGAREPKPYWSGDTDRGVGTRVTRESQPTHWMPLPA